MDIRSGMSNGIDSRVKGKGRETLLLLYYLCCRVRMTYNCSSTFECEIMDIRKWNVLCLIAMVKSYKGLD